MSKLVGGKRPKISVQEAPPVPTMDEAQVNVDQAEMLRRRRGRAATQLVEQEGSVSTAAKILTGN